MCVSIFCDCNYEVMIFSGVQVKITSSAFLQSRSGLQSVCGSFLGWVHISRSAVWGRRGYIAGKGNVCNHVSQE